MQAAAEGLEAFIEVLPDRLIGQELLELLHVLLVPDWLEQVPELIVQLGQLADFLAHVMDRAGEIGGVEALEGAVGRQRRVQLAEQPLIVDDEAELLLRRAFFIEPVHAGDRLQKVMLAAAACRRRARYCAAHRSRSAASRRRSGFPDRRSP